jgi:hypothetical protein
MPASKRLVLLQDMKSRMATLGHTFTKSFIIALIVVAMGGWLYLLTKAALWIIHVV